MPSKRYAVLMIIHGTYADQFLDCYVRRACIQRSMEDGGWRMKEESLHGTGDGADHGDDDDDSMRISAVATRRDRRLSFVGVAFIFRSREFRIYDGGRDLLFFSSEVMSV